MRVQKWESDGNKTAGTHQGWFRQLIGIQIGLLLFTSPR